MGALTRMWVPAARRLGLGRFVPAGVGPQRLSGAIRFIVMALVIRGVIATSDLPFIERQFWAAIAVLFTIGAATWLLLHVNASIERYFRNGLQWSGRTDVASLVRIGRWFADGLVLLVAVLVVIKRFGGDPTAALAGVGIGGIAVALAAQKTLENVIGGLSLIFDRAVRVGDFLKVGEASGTVDSIGLRSTRIRTLDRTMLSVPNGQIANVSIETISSRDMFWFHHFVGLRYETTPAQIRAVVGGIVRRLAGHPAVDPASVRAQVPALRPLVARHRGGRLHPGAGLGAFPRDPGGIAARHDGGRRAGRHGDCAAVPDAAPRRREPPPAPASSPPPSGGPTSPDLELSAIPFRKASVGRSDHSEFLHWARAQKIRALRDAQRTAVDSPRVRDRRVGTRCAHLQTARNPT